MGNVIKLAFVGKMRSGKDTAATRLVDCLRLLIDHIREVDRC